LTYLFVSDVQIKTAQGAFCSGYYGMMAPQIGDKVLYFSYFPAKDPKGTFASVDVRMQLIFGRGNRLYPPSGLEREIGLKSFQDLVEKLRSLPEIRRVPSSVGAIGH
jgi:hypothetical protein